MKTIFSLTIIGIILFLSVPLFSNESDTSEKVVLGVNYIVCGSYQQKDDLMRYCKDLQDKATLMTKTGPFRVSLNYHIVLVNQEELPIKERARQIISEYENLIATHKDVGKKDIINTLVNQYSISVNGFLRCLYIEKFGESFATDLKLSEEIKHWNGETFILFGYLGTEVLDLIRINKIFPSLIVLHNVPVTPAEREYLNKLPNTKIINIFTKDGKEIPFVGDIKAKSFPKTANIELEFNDNILTMQPQSKTYDIVQNLEASSIVDLCSAAYKFESRQK